MIQFGQAVKYTEGDKTFDALVLGVRTDLPSHLGASGEPLVHLAFADPAKASVAGTGNHGDVIAHRFDVAHSTHEFTEEERKQHGDAYPGGRWAFPGEEDVATQLDKAGPAPDANAGGVPIPQKEQGGDSA